MTKAEIKAKINQKNKQLANVNNQLKQYQNLQTKVNKIISLLKDSLKSLNSAMGYLKKGYNYNKNITAVKLNDTNIDEVTEIKKYLELRVNPNISSKIKDLKNNKNKLNNEINKLWREYYKADM